MEPAAGRNKTETIFRAKCSSESRAILFTAALWLICSVFSVARFSFLHRYAPVWETIFWSVLTLPIALTLSFCVNLGVIGPSSLRPPIPVVLALWFSIGGLHYLFLRHRLWLAYILLGLILLIAAKGCSGVAIGLSGI